MSETSSTRERSPLIGRPVQPPSVTPTPAPIGSPVVTPPQELPPPVLIQARPNAGVPGDTITLDGGGLTNTTMVLFIDSAKRSVPAQFERVNDFELRVTVPNVLAGQYEIGVIVQNPNQRPVSAAGVPFAVTMGATPPMLDPIDPFDPGAGPVGTIVMIHGKHLGSVTGVQFNGAAAQFHIVGGQELTAIVPMDAGTGPVTVMAPAGWATSNKNFVLVKSGPTIGSVLPNPAPPNTEVDITGTQLLGVTKVTFRGVKTQFRVIREKELKATVPMLSPGQADIVVTNASGSTTFTQFAVAGDEPQPGIPPPVQPPIGRPGGPFRPPRGGFPEEPIDFEARPEE